MSMEIYALSDVQLPSMDAWQQAIDAEEMPLRLSTPFTFGELRGVLPSQLRDKATAFECDHWSATELIADYPDIDFGRQWKYALAFRWGSNVYDGVAAYLAASAYVRATAGVVLDCEQGRLVSPEGAASIAADFEKSVPMIEEVMRKVAEQFRK